MTDIEKEKLMYKVFVTTADGTFWLGYQEPMGYEDFVDESEATLFKEPMTIDSPEIGHWINTKLVLNVGSKRVYDEPKV